MKLFTERGHVGSQNAINVRGEFVRVVHCSEEFRETFESG